MTKTPTINQFIESNFMQLIPQEDTEMNGNKDESVLRTYQKLNAVEIGFQNKEDWQSTFKLKLQVLIQKN